MNSELEALVLAFDAAKETQGSEGKRLEAILQARMDDVLNKHPHLTEDALNRIVHFAWMRWVKAGGRFTALPPKA